MPELILEAGRGEKNYFRDLWRYRELFYFLSWRDILIRYKQTVVGIAWAVLRPFLTMLVFTFIFSRVAKLHAGGTIPYALMVMAGMLPWQFFGNSLMEASGSLIENTNLISKVYFPRLIIPSSSVITSFIDFLITLVIMAFMMVWFRFAPDWHIVFLPLFILLLIACALGSGLWLAALNAEYRDFRYIVPFIVQFGLYLSPVGFSSSIVPAKWRLVYALNPCVGIIDGFRWSMLGSESPLWMPAVLVSVAVTCIICVSSIWYFRRMEKTFADII